MIGTQFRVLFRQFLFRIADLELLAPEGDISRLLGQFASLLLFLGIVFSGRLLAIDERLPYGELLIRSWAMEHSLIAATMLVVGIFAVLSWDATFPDLRDVFVLSPLPIPMRTFFLARIAASASALALTVIVFNLPCGVALPFALSPKSTSLVDLLLSTARYRLLAAYWITMLSAGAFIYGSVLMLQGLSATLLPRRIFLKVSAFLQLSAFSLMIGVYFLQPSWTTPAALLAPEHQPVLAWLPSYWFLGLFQQLNGSMHEAVVQMAARARYGLAIVIAGSIVTYVITWLRAIRKIVEEPDIARGFRSSIPLPNLSNSLSSAILHFSVRTLLRSRRHRMLMAFYLGAGFSILILFTGLPGVKRHLSTTHYQQIFSSAIMLCASILGTRVVFAIPFDTRANWIFRMTQVRSITEYMAAIRPPIFILGILPMWMACAAFFVWSWDAQLAARHLSVIALAASMAAWLLLYRFRKIPFTCSWLPGKSIVHMAWLVSVGFLFLLAHACIYQWSVLNHNVQFFTLLTALITATVALRWIVTRDADEETAIVQFDEFEEPAILTLGLHRNEA